MRLERPRPCAFRFVDRADRRRRSPSTATLKRLPPVCPMTRAATFEAAARSSTLVRQSGATDTTTRDADSPKSAAASFSWRSDATRPPAIETSAPMPPVSKQLSATAIARPPSEQSCAERIRRSSASVTRDAGDRVPGRGRAAAARLARCRRPPSGTRNRPVRISTRPAERSRRPIRENAGS